MSEENNVHLFVATPMYGGQCFGFYTQSLLTLQNVLGQSGITASFSFLFNESLIQRARNALVHGFLKSEATHLMFIDADITFNSNDILGMIHADKEIICGIYPKKEINWPSIKNAVLGGVPVEELKSHTGDFVVNLIDYQGEVTVPIGEPVEIWNGGTGFMLIKREVLEKLSNVVPSYVNNVTDLSGNIRNDEIKEFFACAIEEETRILLSEDYYFCKLARMNGMKVWAAPWAQLSHIGTYAFEGQLLRTP